MNYGDVLKNLVNTEEGITERKKQVKAILISLSNVEPIKYEKENTGNILTIPDVHGDIFTALFPLVRNGIIEISIDNNGEVTFKEGKNAGNFKRIVYLGDYVDRGPYSYDVLDILEKVYNLINKGNENPESKENKLVLLAGNHDLSEIDMEAEGNKTQQRGFFQEKLNNFVKKLKFFHEETIKGKYFIFSHAPLVDNYRKYNKKAFFAIMNYIKNNKQKRLKEKKLKLIVRMIIYMGFMGIIL